LGKIPKATGVSVRRKRSELMNEFFLYPTYTGQTRDRFKDQYHAYFDASMAAKREGELTIRYYAQIDEAFEVTSSKVLMDLDRHYVMFFGTWPLQIRIIIGIIGIALIATSAVPWRAKKP